MSLRAILWAFDQEILPSSRKFVLVALCNFSTDTGAAYPSVETITRITGLQHQAVRNALANLVMEEVIEDTGKRTGGTGQVKVYRLPPEACEPIVTNHSLKDSAKTPQRL